MAGYLNTVMCKNFNFKISSFSYWKGSCSGSTYPERGPVINANGVSQF